MLNDYQIFDYRINVRSCFRLSHNQFSKQCTNCLCKLTSHAFQVFHQNFSSVNNSRVMQGSVLGSVLFLIFINDLESSVSNTVLKFADDTKLFRPLVSRVDREQLQSDLYTICKWADRWNMKFNVPKYKVIRYSRNFSDIDPLYLVYGMMCQ